MILVYDMGVLAEARVAVTCTSSSRWVARLSVCGVAAMAVEGSRVAVAERTTEERIVFLFIIQYLLCI